MIDHEDSSFIKYSDKKENCRGKMFNSKGGKIIKNVNKQTQDQRFAEPSEDSWGDSIDRDEEVVEEDYLSHSTEAKESPWP